MRLRLTSATVAAAALVCGLTGCGGNDAPTHISSPTPAPTTSAAQGPQALAEQQATALLHTYFRLDDAIEGNPKATFGAMKKVLVPAQLTKYRAEVAALRSKGMHTSGALKIVWARPQMTNVRKGYAATVVRFCYDVSDVKLIDGSGAVVPQPSGAVPEGIGTYSMINAHAQDPTAWRIANRDLKEGTKCADD